MSVGHEQQDRVSVITIDRPRQANSIDLATAREMSAILDRVAADESIRAVVLTGAGERVFCAGMDLGAVAAGQAAEINAADGGFAGIVRRDLPQPVIAAVNGAAIGGGFEIVLACDLVVAADHARFALPEVRHGLIAASGGLVRLPRRIPAALANELLLTGEPITAAKANELGLVNRVVTAAELRAEAVALARTIAERDPGAVQASIAISRAVSRAGEAQAWTRSTAAAASLPARPAAVSS